MASNKTLMVVGVLLLACLFAEGDSQEKDNVKPVRPQTHGGWWGGGWGGGGPGGGWGGGGWGGGGRGGGWGGGGGGWGGGGGGWGGGGHGGGWGGGGDCSYWCGRGRRCCTPQEIARLTGEKDVKAETVVGTEGYGGAGGGGGYGGGYGGGHGGWGGGGGGHGGWGGGHGCYRWCYGRCCTPQEIASLTAEKDVKTDTDVGTQGHDGVNHSDQEAKGKETKSNEPKVNPNLVKQGEVKN